MVIPVTAIHTYVFISAISRADSYQLTFQWSKNQELF